MAKCLKKLEKSRVAGAVSGARFRHVPDPADSALISAFGVRSRPAVPVCDRKTPKRVNGASRGQQGGVKNRVYHAGMAPDTITLPRQATPAAWPELPTTEQPAAAVTTALMEPGATAPTVAESESAAPPNPQQPPDLDLLGDRIAELSARIQAATYELLCYLREFDRQHGWEGFRSCAHWLNWRTGLDLGAAREKLRVAAALAELNHLSAAMACGRLSYSVVRALTRVATPDNEARLVAVACCATGAQVERLVRAWRQANREAQPDAQPDAEQVRLARRALSTRVDDDGMVVVRARLTPEVGAVVLRHAPDGGVLDVGRRTRTLPTALRRAVEGRDRNQCQFSGCSSRHCDAHHVVHWADGGATRLQNLVLLCRFHHRAVHEEGFQVVAGAAGRFQFLRPDGKPLPAVPPALHWRGAGAPLVAPTVARLSAAGITIGPHTATPEWYGESLNVAAALDVLWQPRDRRPRVAAARGAP